MTKKEYIITMLKTISLDVLPIAPDLLYLVENNPEWTDLTSTLYNIIHEFSFTVKDKIQQEKIQKSLTFLQKLKDKEADSQIHEKKDIEDLENVMNQI